MRGLWNFAPLFLRRATCQGRDWRHTLENCKTLCGAHGASRGACVFREFQVSLRLDAQWACQTGSLPAGPWSVGPGRF